MQNKRFKIVNEGFLCAHCKKEVPKTSGTTPRNHCPFCLWSMHVDVNPGDRANSCKGMMRPVGIYTHTKKSYIILHQCTRCGGRVKAKAIISDKNTSDDFEIILKISGNPINENEKN